MSGWAEVFLGVIAVATLATAIVQIGVLVAAGRLARRIDRLADHVEQELKPIFGHLNAIGRDASRAAALAATQVERADRLFTDLVERLEQTLNTVQTLIAGPLREAAALVSAFRAAMQVIRDLRGNGRSRSRADDEDALFI